MMTAYRELIKRLEKATGPDTELDLDLCIAFQIVGSSGSDGINVRRPDESGWEPTDLFHDPMCCDEATPLTASIDAALSLVEKMLPGWEWQVGNYIGEIGQDVLRAPSDDHHAGLTFAATPPLALLIALLRALEAQSKDKEDEK